MYEGPPATDWKKGKVRPFINLEPPYENHLAYQSRKPHSDASVRRATYWSLLASPPAGVTYGGHGVWGWDDGTKPPVDHAGTGIPLPWRQALRMPAAEQMRHLAKIFGDLEWWRLRPAPDILARQPGREAADRHISAARTERGDLALIYSPRDRTISVRASQMPPTPKIVFLNPRTGERTPAVAVLNNDTVDFATPDDGDWLLLLESEKR